MPEIIHNPNKLNDDALLEEPVQYVPAGDQSVEDDLKSNNVRLRF